MTKWFVFAYPDYEASGGMNDCVCKSNVFSDVLVWIENFISSNYGVENMQIINNRSGNDIGVERGMDLSEFINKIYLISELTFDEVNVLVRDMVRAKEEEFNDQ